MAVPTECYKNSQSFRLCSQVSPHGWLDTRIPPAAPPQHPVQPQIQAASPIWFRCLRDNLRVRELKVDEWQNSLAMRDDRSPHPG